jgi:ABC-type protease/lipase transport system fused ATPase/permease subunit
MDPIEYIRKRTREDYTRLVFDRCTQIRIWVQENGEVAAIAALVLGIFIVLAFRFVFTLIALAVVAAFVVYKIALPGGDSGNQPSGNDSSKPN